jgi:LacI family transcriptional regulator, galactose operon repressor
MPSICSEPAEAMQKKRITLRDVAEVVGLHVSTVSRALDPNSRSSVSGEVAARVLAAASAMGYRPNRMAYGLRTNRSMTTGIVLPDIANVIFPPIVRGVESVLEAEGYASFIVNTDNSPRREERLLETLLDRGVDGVVHAAATREDPAALEISRQGVPVVSVNRRVEDTSVPFVVNDDESGLRQVVAHLWDLGHRRIGHVAGPQDTSTGFHRLEAFARCCEARGCGDGPIAVSKAYTREEGRRCMDALLGQSPSVTAVVAANDMLALGVIEALRARGLRCPEDVSVTGFNDMPFLDLIPPPLTTVRIEQFDAGVAAAGLLLRLMRHEEGVESVTLPVSLRIRESTAAA